MTPNKAASLIILVHFTSWALLKASSSPGELEKASKPDVGGASAEHAGTGLSGRAAVPRGAHCRQPGSIDLGHRLAASAHRGRDAERRPSARPVQRVDAGCGGAPENPRRQSGAALWVFGLGVRGGR